MGKQSANASIPHWVVYRAVVVLHMSYVLLTLVVEGLCHTSNHNNRAFLFQHSWHVVSLCPSGGEQVM
jgi:hypothetical protein